MTEFRDLTASIGTKDRVRLTIEAGIATYLIGGEHGVPSRILARDYWLD
jgi:hypothetical protein